MPPSEPFTLAPSPAVYKVLPFSHIHVVGAPHHSLEEAGIVGPVLQTQTLGLGRRALGPELPPSSPHQRFHRVLRPWARSGTTQHMTLCCCLECEAHPGRGLWPEPAWAWSRSALHPAALSQMSPALRASWEMSTHADLGPLAEGAASLSLQSLSPPSPCSQHSRERSQRALEPAKRSSV